MIEKIRSAFEEHENPEQAKAMQKYMKDRFLYLGIKAPLRNEISKPFFVFAKQSSREELIEIVLQLWDLPEREYQYLAIEFLKKNAKKLAATDLVFIRDLIVQKSWWDTVDSLAVNPLGNLLLRYSELQKEMDQWINDSNMWIRRCALLYQLKYKEKTNENQLFGYCMLCAHEKEFFIRKAIGWALRQHAKTYPDHVRQFVLANENIFSSLSKKEALKHVF